MSIETIYLAEMLIACRELRETFKTKDSETFQLHVDFLRSAILDDSVTKNIDNEIKELRAALLKEKKDEATIAFRCGFVVTKALFKFLNSTLELTHEDITGSAYDDLIDIPDIIITEQEVLVDADPLT
jgi:hypothetical protein